MQTTLRGQGLHRLAEYGRQLLVGFNEVEERNGGQHDAPEQQAEP